MPFILKRTTRSSSSVVISVPSRDVLPYSHLVSLFIMLVKGYHGNLVQLTYCQLLPCTSRRIEFLGFRNSLTESGFGRPVVDKAEINVKRQTNHRRNYHTKWTIALRSPNDCIWSQTLAVKYVRYSTVGMNTTNWNLPFYEEVSGMKTLKGRL